MQQVGRPYELNPRTLDTLGESNMDGQIGQRLAGHYRVVREPSGQLRCVCFGTLVRIPVFASVLPVLQYKIGFWGD
eukprot:1157842-Pelagomonas_calceolata.AAC.8